MRAVSIKVDAELGVAGLIFRARCGCRLDPDQRQGGSRASLAERNHPSQRSSPCDRPGHCAGAKDTKDNSAAAGKEAHSVSLELSPEQVKKIAIAKELGKLSLAVRSAVEQRDAGDAGTMSGCDVSPEIAGQNAIASESATVVVYAGDKAKEYSVPKHDTGAAAFGCDSTRKIAGRGAGSDERTATRARTNSRVEGNL